MDQGKRKLATTLLAAASLTALSAPLHAATFAEPGDAGQTLATATAAGTFNGLSTGLTGISGTIAGTNGLDADLYSFTLTTTTALRFVATSTAGIDTSIFLFSSTGAPIIANDDQSNTSFQGAFSTTTTLTAGTYYFGIALSGNEPVNSANQLLFTTDQPTTLIRGAASGLNPATQSTFNGQTFFAEGGAYGIAITAVPEPSSVVTAVVGAIASFGFVRRLRRSQAA